MTQSKSPSTTSFWFYVHTSYRFGGDSCAKFQKEYNFPFLTICRDQNYQNRSIFFAIAQFDLELFLGSQKYTCSEILGLDFDVVSNNVSCEKPVLIRQTSTPIRLKVRRRLRTSPGRGTVCLLYTSDAADE